MSISKLAHILEVRKEETDDRWNFETGQCRVLGKHDDSVSAMVWCPDFSEAPPLSYHNRIVTDDRCPNNGIMG
jgi:hypothetical protein